MYITSMTISITISSILISLVVLVLLLIQLQGPGSRRRGGGREVAGLMQYLLLGGTTCLTPLV